MLQLALSPEIENFRQEFRNWIASHPPPPASNDSSLATFQKLGREWQQQLASGGWLGMHWPREFGGGGQTLVQEAVVQEELVRVGAPQILGLFGITMVGPVLIQHGNSEQKSKFLGKILSAEHVWCQGFSEPGAGSDLANIKTRARATTEGFFITGQKIWTSFAHIADYCFLLCRTGEGDVKHQGLSYLLVDMKSKGVTTRPLKQISGDEEFNEVFFDEVFVPRENLIGKEGDGWKIAISTLMYERVVLTFARQLQSEVALRSLLKRCAEGGVSEELKNQLGREVARSCAVRALAYSHLLNYAGGKSPGPEGSLDKLFWSESFQSIAKLALRMDGLEGLESENSDMHRYLYSRGRTIAAGTSEIQRGIIAERVLGLPRLKFSL